MWYVVQVETGREKTACDDIKQAAEDVLDEWNALSRST